LIVLFQHAKQQNICHIEKKFAFIEKSFSFLSPMIEK